MSRYHVPKAVILVIVLATALTLRGADETAISCEVESYFSPQQDIEQVVLDNLSNAKRYVHLSLYGITNRRLADKLLELHRRGVEVIVCLDKTQAMGRHDLHAGLTSGGVRVVIKKSSTLEHNKFVVIDGERVIMGSWNWSESANRQDNSDVVIYDCPDEVAKFEEAFRGILERDKNTFSSHSTASATH